MRNLISRVICVLALALPGVSFAAGEREAAEAALEQCDFASALRLYRIAAEAGDASAQVSLAYMYWYGESQYGPGVAANASAAIEWFARAEEQGNSVAKAMLSLLFDEGGPESSPQAVTAAARGRSPR